MAQEKDVKDKKNSKSVLCIKLKASVPGAGVSLLAAIFVHLYKAQVLGAHSVLISGDSMFREKLKRSIPDFIAAIDKIRSSGDMHLDMTHKLHDAMIAAADHKSVSDIIHKLEQKNVGEVEFFVRRVISGALHAEEVNVELAYELTGQGEFQEVNARERIDSMNISERVEMAMRYHANEKPKAEKAVKDMARDIAVAVFNCVIPPSKKFSGIMYYNLFSRNVYSVIALCNDNGSYELPSLDRHIYDIYADIMDALEKHNTDVGTASRFEQVVHSADKSQLFSILSGGQPDALNRFLATQLAFAGPVADAASRIETMNCLLVEYMFAPQQNVPETGSKEESSEEKQEERIKQQVVDIKLVLSPTRGRKLSTLVPGDKVMIQLDPESPASMKILKRLDLIEGEKIKPVPAVLHSIKQNSQLESVVLVKITNDLYGKAIEEEDILVKTIEPAVAQPEKGSGGMLVLGLVAGLLLITGLALLFWFI